MLQFDVYANPKLAQRSGFPYLLVMQSDQLSQHGMRFVMPLARMVRPRRLPRRLSEEVLAQGEPLLLAAQLCAALPARLLQSPVASLRAQSDVLRAALDAVLGGV